MSINPIYFKKYDSEKGKENYLFWKGLVCKDKIKRSSEKKSIILRPDAIGDYVLFSPYLAGLKTIYPDHTFLFIGIAEVCHLAQASGVGDNYLEWDRHEYEKRGEYWREWLRSLSNVVADVLIYPCYSREANADEMVAVVNADEKIGIRCDGCNIYPETGLYNEQFYTKIINVNNGQCHETERNKDFLAALNAAPLEALPLWDDSDFRFVRSKIPDYFLKNPIIAIAPGASVESKCWPLEKFRQIIDYLLKNTKGVAFILGGKKEKQKAAWLLERTRYPERIFSIAGRFNIRQSAAFLSMSTLFIGNDSGLAHIAGSQGISCHVITGGAHYGRFLPNPEMPNINVYTNRLSCFGCNGYCNNTLYECIAGASFEYEKLLGEI